jgi:hypothetical protein
MVKLIVDKSLPDRLKSMSDQAELCDENGELLGHYLPKDVYHKLVYQWIHAQVDDREIERRRNEPGDSSLAEIWQRLGQT